MRELDPGSRALLDLSVRRGLGDREIAGILGTDPGYVASTRTGVIQTLVADLRLDEHERAELEQALAQLPADAWLPRAQPEPALGADNGGAPGAAAVGEPAAEAAPPAEAALPAEAAPAQSAPPAAGAAPGDAAPEKVAEPAAEAAPDEEGGEREELAHAREEAAAGEGGRAAKGGEAAVAAEPARGPRTALIAGSVALVLLCVALVAVLALNGDIGGSEDEPADQPAPPAEPVPSPEGEGSGRAGERGREGGRAGEPGRKGGRSQEPGRGRRSRGPELRALPGSRGARGTARLDGNRLQLRVSGLPRRRGRYQVWLYESLIDAKRLGRLRPAGNGRFRGRFRARGIGRYRYVDISLEPRDGNSNHSGRSVLRIATRKLR